MLRFIDYVTKNKVIVKFFAAAIYNAMTKGARFTMKDRNVV
jgi:hypothetical protein